MSGLVSAVVLAGAFVACGHDDTVVQTLGPSDASTQGSDGASIDAAVYDAGSDATIGTTICTALTLCDDGGSCGNGSACVPPIPAGWSLTGFDPAHQTTCGSGYATHDSFAVTDGGAAQCSCTCTPGTPPSCTNLQAVLTTGAACNASSTAENVNATCTMLTGAGFATTGSALEAHLEPLPNSCTSSLATTLTALDAGAARECDFGGDGGEFCSGHATCVASSGAPRAVCIAQPYSGSLPPTCVSSCPAGFTASCAAVADSANDSRDCTACTCEWNNDGCSLPTVSFSASGSCGAPTTTISPDTCASTTITTIASMTIAGAVVTPTCGKIADTSASGNVTTTGERIVCCAN